MSGITSTSAPRALRAKELGCLRPSEKGVFDSTSRWTSHSVLRPRITLVVTCCAAEVTTSSTSSGWKITAETAEVPSMCKNSSKETLGSCARASFERAPPDQDDPIAPTPSWGFQVT
mmetsp:Transcript_92414/g.299015  ORF Transcript_92414/g.299015 Transcript_92414/m.299015 type:complete len:117 (+) Transcript_92414:482-832(+)